MIKSPLGSVSPQVVKAEEALAAAGGPLPEDMPALKKSAQELIDAALRVRAIQQVAKCLAAAGCAGAAIAAPQIRVNFTRDPETGSIMGAEVG